VSIHLPVDIVKYLWAYNVKQQFSRTVASFVGLSRRVYNNSLATLALRKFDNKTRFVKFGDPVERWPTGRKFLLKQKTDLYEIRIVNIYRSTFK